MNRLVIIGNGFDLAHGLKTSYADFLEWYKRDYIAHLKGNFISQYDDGLCSIDFTGKKNTSVQHNSLYEFDELYIDFQDINKYSIKTFNKSPLLTEIEKNYKLKGWIDIEEDYYRLLKEIIFSDFSIQIKIEKVSRLNKQLNYLKLKLAEYLRYVQNEREGFKEIDLVNIICSNIDLYHEVEPTMTDIIALANRGLQNIESENTKIINFNYTNTVEEFCEEYDIECSYIHGNLSNPESIIFGYGDEVDEKFKLISNYNENEYLRNFKSYRYLESGVYRDILRFIESDKYQIVILGHSCGNSDRTLLNTLFNHKNCISIKSYYYRDDNGKDNYSDIIMNISRNFNDIAAMRSKVVDKEHCQLLK